MMCWFAATVNRFSDVLLHYRWVCVAPPCLSRSCDVSKNKRLGNVYFRNMGVKRLLKFVIKKCQQ